MEQLLFAWQRCECGAELFCFLGHCKHISLIGFFLWAPDKIFWFWPPLFAKRVDFTISCDCKNPRRDAGACWIKQMCFVPHRGQRLLGTLFGQSGFSTGLKQKSLYPRSKMAEQFRKSDLVLIVADMTVVTREAVWSSAMRDLWLGAGCLGVWLLHGVRTNLCMEDE